jgi:hypothetical protein
MYFDLKAVYYAIAAANVTSGLIVAWYTLWWLKKADLCDCEPNALGSPINQKM